jgi:hypothetical protein
MSLTSAKLLHAIASKQFDYASIGNECGEGLKWLIVQNKGREMVFSDLSHPWHIIKAAAERDVRSCQICQDEDTYLGCIFCGFGHCQKCLLIHQHNVNPFTCTVCKASVDIQTISTMSPDSCIFPLVKHVKPRFEINCIFSFIGAEQQIGDSLLTIEDDNLCLIQCDEILHRNLQTLPDLMCAILESSNEKHVFPKDLYKISTCLMENSIYPWDGVLERIPVFQALMRRDGKFFFNRERDDIEQAIVDNATALFFSSNRKY